MDNCGTVQTRLPDNVSQLHIDPNTPITGSGGDWQEGVFRLQQGKSLPL